MKPLLLTPFIALAILFGGCGTPSGSPEAVAFDTLLQAQNFIKAKHDLFEVEVGTGKVPIEKQLEVHKAYVAAQQSIKTAAELAANGLAASTPAEVDRLVATFVSLVVKFVPPEK